MTNQGFVKAQKYGSKLRLGIAGPSGSGKTYTALALATGLVKDARIAVVDTEHGSAKKYADLFTFDVMEMEPPYHPDRFSQAITRAANDGYDVIILDSLSHAYEGDGGILALVDEAAKRMKTFNSFTAWKDVTPIHRALIESILSAPLHVIGTMRSKTEYTLEKDDKGKSVPRKVGMAPIQRPGFEYEFDILLEMTMDNDAIVQKSRFPAITGQLFGQPGASLAEAIAGWLEGTPPPEPATATEDDILVINDLGVKVHGGNWPNVREGMKGFYNVTSLTQLSASNVESAIKRLRSQLPQPQAEE